MKTIKITESQIKKIIQDVVIEQQETENYMFFGNIQQMQRQCELLMKENHEQIDNILKEHDWAQDHIAEAKSLLDQVFDFLMNETKTKNSKKVETDFEADPSVFSVNESSQVDESKNKPTNPKLWASCLSWAKSKYKVCPSAYCNGAAAKRYKSKGGKWKKVK